MESGHPVAVARAELRCLCTIFRPENVSTNVAGVNELQLLTGFPASDLVAFRPQRLCLHELVIRVTADFSVPDGSRLEDLGINFRQMTGLLLARYLEPQMGAVGPHSTRPGGRWRT